ncbi:MAG TPA: alpha/beta fold hydrolase [Gemmatirosa sp.]
MRARGLDFAVWTTPAVPGAVPLCCVNGGLLYGHRSLWPTLSPLAARRQIVLYDQRGRGESAAPPGARAARIEHDALDLPALRTALGIAEWDLLGHSWGGGIAMRAAAEPDAGVRRLVLVDAVGVTGAWLPGLHARALERLARIDPHAHDALAVFDPARLREPDVAYHAAYARAFSPAWFVDQSLAPRFAPPNDVSVTGVTVAARLRRDGYDWSDIIGGVRARTLLLHGDADILDVSVGQATAHALPGALLTVLAHAGHMPFWEAAAEFFAAVELFLEGPTLPTTDG